MHCLPAFHDRETTVGAQICELYDWKASKSPTTSSNPSTRSCGTGREPDAHHQGDHGRHARRLKDRTRMRVVIAIGGNALLRRGEPMTAEAQRENVRVAARALVPVGQKHELVVSHGNGPQVGLLALQSAAYESGRDVPARRARRADRRHDRLRHRAGAGQSASRGETLRHRAHHGRSRLGDPAFANPTKFVGPTTTSSRPTSSPPRGDGPSSSTVPTGAEWCPLRSRSASSRFAPSGGSSRRTSS